MKRSLLGVPILLCVSIPAGLSWGCDDTADLEEYLQATVMNSVVQVDTFCDNGGCDTAAELAVSLRLDADHALPENDELAFLQYRVDYTLPGEEVPFFAAPVEVILQNGGESVLTLQVSGSRQRNALAHLREDFTSGTARITLAGYDEKDNRADFEFGFNIQFGDFIDETTGEQGEAI